jgi:TATA-binding protein-associated factor
LERIVALLETGSSPAVRQTAAKQLGDIARRFFPTAEPTVDSHNVDDVSGIARYKYEEGWRSSVALVYRILPFLASKSVDTRLAAVNALNHIAEAVPLWYPELPNSEQPLPPSDMLRDSQSVGQQIETLDIEAIVNSGSKLGSSAEMSSSKAEDDAMSYDSGAGSSKTAFLQNLGIDSAFVPKSESLSDVDVDDELMFDVKPQSASKSRRPAKTKRPAETTTVTQEVKPEQGSRKRIKLESTSSGPKPEASQSLDSDRAVQTTQPRRPGRPKGSKSKSAPASTPSSPSGTSTAQNEDMFRGLSGRQVLVLKRKLKTNLITVEQATEEAKK